MTEKQRITTKDFFDINEVHILDFMEAMGYTLKQNSTTDYKTVEHDSLVLNVDNRFYWNSRGIGNYGAVNLAKEVLGTTNFKEIREKFKELNLLDSENAKYSKTTNATLIKDNGKFIYPDNQEVNHIDNAMKYLTDVRKLDKKIVLALKKHGLVAEDKMKNVVFKWRDSEGNLCGAEKRGTSLEKDKNSFRQITSNSKGGFRLDIGIPNKLIIFESTIDALSYFDLKRPENVRLQSLSGVNHTEYFHDSLRDFVSHCTKTKRTDVSIILAVDNDSAGQRFIEEQKDLIGNLKIEVPQAKDWNEDLINLRTNKYMTVNNNQNIQTELHESIKTR